MKLQLDDSVASPQDLQALIADIRDYARWHSHETIKRQAGAKRLNAESPVPAAALATIRAWHATKPISRGSLDTLLAELENHARHAPTMTITLAAPAPAGLKKQLVAWCRQHVAAGVLVSFQYNSALLGGLVVQAGSRIFDWSFRRAILANLEHFPEVLQRV